MFNLHRKVLSRNMSDLLKYPSSPPTSSSRTLLLIKTWVGNCRIRLDTPECGVALISPTMAIAEVCSQLQVTCPGAYAPVDEVVRMHGLRVAVLLPVVPMFTDDHSSNENQGDMRWSLVIHLFFLICIPIGIVCICSWSLKISMPNALFPNARQ